MMLTPLLFGFMFFRFASGLVLYWLTGNLVGIGQQAFLNRRLPSGQLASTPPAP
jgi:YidC/Oxa1 family membrane protein insertase